MKKLLIAVASVFAIGFTQAQTVDEVINKHIEAMGGKGNIEKIQNVVMEGTLTIQGAPISVTLTQVQGKLSRQDINAMGMKGYDFVTDKDGWSFMPFQGMQKPEPKTAEDVKESQSDLDLSGPLYNYATKGHKVELLGKEDVEGTECFKIKATLNNGKEMTFFLDPASYLIVRAKEKKKVNGQEMELSVDFSDYKDVEGVKMPFSVTQPFGTVTMTSIKANQPVDEKLFTHE
ncbi:MAG: hypothetical protein ABIX01_17690 [Chitinophagaceae bacterium]